MLANHWHLSHFLVNSLESARSIGQKYPVVIALCARLLGPEWFPHSPSWISDRIVLTYDGLTQVKYGPEKDLR